VFGILWDCVMVNRGEFKPWFGFGVFLKILAKKI